MPDDDMTVSIEGLEELEKNLEALAGTECRKIVRAGLYAGSTAIASRSAAARAGASRARSAFRAWRVLAVAVAVA